MTPPGTFERVYAVLKQRLREGLYRPGSRLEPALLSDELNASVTPVRDALHRLTGERLVEAPRHEGFRVPLMTEATLRHLYAWHHDLVLLALANHQRADPDQIPTATTGPEATHKSLNALFLSLARATGNPEHLLALQSLIERIEPAQHIEAVILDSVAGDSQTILEAFNARDQKALRRALARYHRHRLGVVPALLEQLNRTGSDGA